MNSVVETMDISVMVNGRTVRRRVPVRLSLADFLRHSAGLTGTHVGCEHGVCGACTLTVDGEIVRGCLMLAVQTDGCAVQTIEGFSESGKIRHLQDAFVGQNGVQCGFCTPGMLIAANALLAQEPKPTRDRIREFLSGNYCRCTGYQAIVDAIEQAANAVQPSQEGAA